MHYHVSKVDSMDDFYETLDFGVVSLALYFGLGWFRPEEDWLGEGLMKMQECSCLLFLGNRSQRAVPSEVHKALNCQSSTKV